MPNANRISDCGDGEKGCTTPLFFGIRPLQNVNKALVLYPPHPLCFIIALDSRSEAVRRESYDLGFTSLYISTFRRAASKPYDKAVLFLLISIRATPLACEANIKVYIFILVHSWALSRLCSRRCPWCLLPQAYGLLVKCDGLELVNQSTSSHELRSFHSNFWLGYCIVLAYLSNSRFSYILLPRPILVPMCSVFC